jgi:hypothetical protein
MRRRDFHKALAAGLLAPGIAMPAAKAKPPRKNTRMHVGADYHVIEGDGITSRENLEYNLRFGVRHISPDPDIGGRRGSPEAKGGAFIPAEGPSGGAFDLDKLKRMRDDCDAAGMTLEGFRMDSG